MYREGRGIKQNYTEAVKWYKKAAQQGDDVAQNNLGVMYHNGTGIYKDLRQAKYWYQKSAAQGNDQAKENLNKLNQ